jgi:hypothetical protein
MVIAWRRHAVEGNLIISGLVVTADSERGRRRRQHTGGFQHQDTLDLSLDYNVRTR